MECIKDSVEQTTAITDILLAAVCFGGIFFLQRGPTVHGGFFNITVWSAAIGLIGLAAALGAAAHGLVLTQLLHQRLWQMLNMALALAVALFVVGVVFDLWGAAASYQALPLMIILSLMFYAATLIYPGIFFVFIMYEGLALIFALGAYVLLSWNCELKGAGLMAAGILLSIIAAGIQVRKSIRLTFIWQFDHNGIYHLVQAVGIILLMMGLRYSVLY